MSWGTQVEQSEEAAVGDVDAGRAATDAGGACLRLAPGHEDCKPRPWRHLA